MAVDPAQYHFETADPKSTFDMIVSGWVPDWPNGSAVIPTLFDGAQTQGDASQNLNYSMLNDPDINKAIVAANNEENIQVQYKLWGDLDRQIMAKAAVIPVLTIGALRMYGTDVRGVTIAAGYGEPDLTVVGLGTSSSS